MFHAYILTIVAIENGDAFARYREAVAPVNAAIGGKIVLRGPTAAIVEGSGAEREAVIVLGFPDIAAATTYINSPEYAALAGLRQAAGRFTIRVIG
jgi:uncharacterized protein (DUF1330 family)